MGTKKIPIIFCVDVEPDLRIFDRDHGAPWHGYNATHQYLAKLRGGLEEATGSPVHYTWVYRLDPQVEETYGSAAWPIEQYPDYVAEFLERGDELGLHTHPYRWDDHERDWIVDNGNQKWINHCLKMAFEAFQSTLKRPCHTFRFGDRFMNNETMAELERLGVRYDLTAEPYKKAVPALNRQEKFTGSIPGCGDMRHVPYRPSKSDWKKADPTRKDGVIEIPMSSGWGPAQPLSQSLISKGKRLVKSLLGLPTKPYQPLETLSLGRPVSSTSMIFDHLLETLEKPYIACVIHTSNPLKEEKCVQLGKFIDHLTSHKRVRDFVFVRPEEALVHLGFLHSEGEEVEEKLVKVGGDAKFESATSGLENR